MKLGFLSLATASLLLFNSQHSNAQLLKKIKDKVAHKAEEKSETPEKTEPAEKKETAEKTETTEQPEKQETAAAAPAPSIKSYENYDFVPGEKVLFEDHFIDDPDGEFPTHWELTSGQAVMNKVADQEAFFLTDGNYVRVKPRMKTKAYLTDPFTVEFDYYNVAGAYGLITFLQSADKEAGINVNNSNVAYNGNEVTFEKNLPEEISNEKFENKWHHVAMAFKGHQLKVYVDQFRVLVVPDTKENFEKIEFGGIGSEKLPLVMNNIRIASGGGMNMIGKKFTDAKLVTHGINFDYNKASIKPESMGTLNMVAKILKDNPEIKFEIGGYTDSDGEDAYNLKLSDQRAAAVKTQLVSMGVDDARLTSKGYGETKPISDNSTPEGKANNRRVEFVKK